MRHTRLVRAAAAACIALLATGTSFAQSPPTLVGAMSRIALDRLATVEAAAEQVPEADYGFRPVAGTRTFGELVAHVADTNRAFCSAIAGARTPVDAEIERTVHAKAALLEHLRTSTAACRTALGSLSDAAMPAPRAFGGGALIDGTAIPVRELPAGMLVTLLASHAEREYGKMTVYLRLKALVPPTSQPRTQ